MVGAMEQEWWRPLRYADRAPFLRQRGAITAELRAWFGMAGSPRSRPESFRFPAVTRPISTRRASNVTDSSGAARTRYLRTSPEFAAKKLLAAGERRIFEFARVFRDREQARCIFRNSRCSNGIGQASPIKRSSRIRSRCSGARGADDRREPVFISRVNCDPLAEVERLTVSDAFNRYADIDLLDTVTEGEGNRTQLAAAAIRSHIKVAADDTWSDIFSNAGRADRAATRAGPSDGAG